MESLREARLKAENEAAACLEQVLAQADRSPDALVRDAAALVRSRRAALRRSGDELAYALAESIERLATVDADALAFVQDADAMTFLAINGRDDLRERHLAVLRSEAALNDLL